MASFMKLVILKNGVNGGIYVEPYAGGAGIALFLVIEGFAETVYLNDLDRSIYAFWHTVVKRNSDLCRRIEEVEVKMEEWHRQKEVQLTLLSKRGLSHDDLFDLGFSTFFLNRTNRSGIVRKGGVIGGKEQNGKWSLDARFNKEGLLRRIRRIEPYKDQIKISNTDAAKFIRNKGEYLPVDRTLFYMDPPYFQKGQSLYQNDYDLEGHREVADAVKSLNHHWVVSYDNCEPIRNLYDGYPSVFYDLSYSAAERYKGREAMFTSRGLELPDFENPARLSKDDVRNFKSRELDFTQSE